MNQDLQKVREEVMVLSIAIMFQAKKVASIQPLRWLEERSTVMFKTPVDLTRVESCDDVTGIMKNWVKQIIRACRPLQKP